MDGCALFFFSGRGGTAAQARAPYANQQLCTLLSSATGIGSSNKQDHPGTVKSDLKFFSPSHKRSSIKRNPPKIFIKFLIFRL